MKELSQTQIEDLRSTFGNSKVAAYMEVADHLKKDSEAMDGLVNTINEGTEKAVQKAKEEAMYYKKLKDGKTGK